MHLSVQLDQRREIMEDCARIETKTVKDILMARQKFHAHYRTLWIVLCFLFIGVLAYQRLQNTSPTIQESAAGTTFGQPSMETVADLDFSQKLKEERSRQAFLIKAHASL